MRALVTGAAGFLGRHFTAALGRRGYDLRLLDVEPRGQFGVHPYDVRTWFAHHPNEDIDLVVHCAAVIGGRARIDGDPLATAENLELDAAMFRWAARARPGRVVYLSSSAVYPISHQDTPGTLSEWQQDVDPRKQLGTPDQVYGWTKLIGEVLAGKLRDVDVPVTVVRPFSGYGADQDETYPFRAFLERARRRDDPFVIWGDGLQRRDFIHVADVVDATLAAVDAEVNGPMNICTGVATSFIDLQQLVCKAVGYEPNVKLDLGAPQGVRYRVGDPMLMRRTYKPRISLEDAVEGALR